MIWQDTIDIDDFVQGLYDAIEDIPDSELKAINKKHPSDDYDAEAFDWWFIEELDERGFNYGNILKVIEDIFSENYSKDDALCTAYKECVLVVAKKYLSTFKEDKEEWEYENQMLPGF